MVRRYQEKGVRNHEIRGRPQDDDPFRWLLGLQFGSRGIGAHPGRGDGLAQHGLPGMGASAGERWLPGREKKGMEWISR